MHAYAPAQGNHVPAGAVSQSEFLIVAAQTFAAFNTVIGIDQDLDGFAFDLADDGAGEIWAVFSLDQFIFSFGDEFAGGGEFGVFRA